MASPPNFSRKACASTNAAMDSAMTAIAGTAVTSLRSAVETMPRTVENIGFYSRLLRSNMLDVMDEDYVRTARAVDGGQRAHEGADRFHPHADHERLAGGDATLQAASAVRPAAHVTCGRAAG